MTSYVTPGDGECNVTQVTVGPFANEDASKNTVLLRHPAIPDGFTGGVAVGRQGVGSKVDLRHQLVNHCTARDPPPQTVVPTHCTQMPTNANAPSMQVPFLDLAGRSEGWAWLPGEPSYRTLEGQRGPPIITLPHPPTPPLNPHPSGER